MHATQTHEYLIDYDSDQITVCTNNYKYLNKFDVFNTNTNEYPKEFDVFDTSNIGVSTNNEHNYDFNENSNSDIYFTDFDTSFTDVFNKNSYNHNNNNNNNSNNNYKNINNSNNEFFESFNDKDFNNFTYPTVGSATLKSNDLDTLDNFAFTSFATESSDKNNSLWHCESYANKPSIGEIQPNSFSNYNRDFNSMNCSNLFSYGFFDTVSSSNINKYQHDVSNKVL